MTKHKDKKSKKKKDKKQPREEVSYGSIDSNEALLQYSCNNEQEDSGGDDNYMQSIYMKPHHNGVRRRNNQREVREMRDIEKEQDELLFLHEQNTSLTARNGGFSSGASSMLEAQQKTRSTLDIIQKYRNALALASAQQNGGYAVSKPEN